MSDEPTPPTARHWWAAVATWWVANATDQNLFWVSVAFVFVVPTFIGLKTSNTTIAWIALICGAFVAIMSRFDDIAELTLGPLAVKRFRKGVDQAEVPGAPYRIQECA